MVALWIYLTPHNIKSIMHSANYSLFIVFLRLLLTSAFVPETVQPVQSQLFSQHSKFKVRLAHIWPFAKTEASVALSSVFSSTRILCELQVVAILGRIPHVKDDIRRSGPKKTNKKKKLLLLLAGSDLSTLRNSEVPCNM